MGQAEVLGTRQFQFTLPVWGATLSPLNLGADIGISIHAPRVGSDRIAISLTCLISYFNPRSPCGERLSPSWHWPSRLYFNPRSPCGERRGFCAFWTDGFPRFQSTLPVWGATSALPAGASGSARFQSTLPVWGATDTTAMAVDYIYISIHAPRVGSDAAMPCCCGGPRRFQSTLPVWGATPL